MWPEPPAPVETFSYKKVLPVRFVISTLSKLLGFCNLSLVVNRNIGDSARESGEYWPLYADTMIGLKRLDNLQQCCESVIEDGIEGDFIETGVWRGGACIFMKGILAANGVTDRKVFVADSFEGLPKPDAEKYPDDAGDKHFKHQSFLGVSMEEVKSNFEKYDLLDENVVFLKGWFKDTLPDVDSDKFAVLRLDGDMYESTMDALSNLYSKLSVGGYCIIDDYQIPGCKQAVTDYREANGISDEIVKIDNSAVYWKRS